MSRRLAVIALTCLLVAGCSGRATARGEKTTAIEIDKRLYLVRAWDFYAVVEPAPEDHGPITQTDMVTAITTATGCRIVDSSYIDRFLLAASLACDAAVVNVAAPQPSCPPPLLNAGFDPAHMIRIAPADIDQLLTETWRSGRGAALP
jgi:hypothetical protein